MLESSAARLHPVGDPLQVDLTLNRWLSGAREEAYADWLAWVLQEVRSPRALSTLLFGDRDVLPPSGLPISVSREQWVPWGHKGCSGRLDCVVRAGEDVIVVIEVKTIGAEAADTVKGEGYARWLDCQPALVKRKLLLAVDGEERGDYQGFILLTWERFCQRLRLMLPNVIKRSLLSASLICSFVGAVEQNILLKPCLAWVGGHNSDLRALQMMGDVEGAIEYIRKVAKESDAYGE